MRRYLLLNCLLLGSCATSADVATTLSQPADSSVQQRAAEQRAQALVSQLQTGKVKFKAPVTIQLGGTGNSASATDASKAKAPVAGAPGAIATNAAKAKAPVAAAPQASATETKPAGGTPWYVFAGLVVLGLAGGFVLRGRLKVPLPF